MKRKFVLIDSMRKVPAGERATVYARCKGPIVISQFTLSASTSLAFDIEDITVGNLALLLNTMPGSAFNLLMRDFTSIGCIRATIIRFVVQCTDDKPRRFTAAGHEKLKPFSNLPKKPNIYWTR